MGSQEMIMASIPKGNIAKTHGGGPDALQGIVERVKKFGFTGYIRVASSVGEEGFIFFVDGDIKLFMHRKCDGSQEVTGQQALKNTYESGTRLDSKIEIHTNIDVPSVLAGIGQQTPAVAASRRGSRRAILAWGRSAQSTAEEEMGRIKDKLKEMQGLGYRIQIEDYLKGDISEVKKKTAALQKNVEMLQESKRSLDEIGAMLSAEDLSRVEAMLFDPAKVKDVKEALKSLEKQVDEKKKSSEAEKAMELEKELEERTENKSRMEREERVYDLVIKHQAHAEGLPMMCQKCGDPLDEEGSCDRCSASAKEKEHLIARLKPNYTFDNFVVGNSNHFAHAAAVSVADEPAVAYNPLFIWSGPGLGKTHLINAIANSVMEKHPNMRVAYFTTEQFKSELVEAMKSGKIDEFRRQYRQEDILIVDDIQFLADSETGQEEFFHCFNALYTVDKQIVLASDRPPKEIPTLKQRLVSRFEGGLTVEIQPPDYETRLAILKQKIVDRGIGGIGDDVLGIIARSITTNIRELEGALTKIIAFSTFNKTEVDMTLAKNVLDGMQKEQKAVPPQEEKVEKKKERGAKSEEEAKEEIDIVCELERSHSYLIKEVSLGKSIELFKECLSKASESRGMAIVRTNPSRIDKDYGLKPQTELYWLTDRESKKSRTIEPSLEKLMYEMSLFMEGNQACVLLLDGLDYLASATSFDGLIQFIRRLVDTVAEADAILLISLSPETLDKQQVSIMEREMDVISFLRS